jgi:DeoR family glycerol-3-phosphate regulon repressor
VIEIPKKQKRQQRLVERIEAQGYATLADLARELAVSEQTVRRDISELDAAGKVRRAHGGAAIQGNIDRSVYAQRRLQRAAEKQLIARQVASLVEDGSSVFLDTGTTCEAIASALTARRHLKVVTYSLRSALRFSERDDFVVAVPAGFVRHVDGAVVGGQDTGFLDQFLFDYAILSVSGMDAAGNICDDDQFEVRFASMAMQRARTILLALDSSKFGKGGLVRLCHVGAVDYVITDRAPDAAISKMLTAHDVKLVTCG